MSDSKNDEAWAKLFDEYKLLEVLNANGDEFVITSKEINQFRESRLMTKFDSRKDLPKIFKDHGLAILPISRGSYKIGKFNVFHDFEDYETHKRADEIYEVPFPDYIETISPDTISSESTAIACADLCSIINDFTGEKELYNTISGRMGSGDFEFNINERKRVFNFEVKGSQIEIDAGFEGYNGIYLIEAKNVLSKDFIIRQVYYPYRTWLSKNLNKYIRNIYLTYSNGVFYLREYAFSNPYDPNSIKLVKSQRYSIINKELTMEYLKGLLTKALPELNSQGAPFPQADDFSRVVNLCEELQNSSSIDPESDDVEGPKLGLFKNEIADIYDFTPRQADYYANAAKYLGLVYINSGHVKLSNLGVEIMQMPLRKRQVKFAELILSSEPFRKVMGAYLNNSGIVSITDVRNIVSTCKIDNLNIGSNTFNRRCSTIKSWVDWILSQVIKS